MVWHRGGCVRVGRDFGAVVGALGVALCATVLLLLAVPSTRAADHAPGSEVSVRRYGIIPIPASLKPAPGYFTLTPTTKLTINVEGARGTARYFKRFIIPATGYDLPISIAEAPQDGAINLVLAPGFSSPEAYTLLVAPKRIVIRASATAGLFYGLQSIRQMLPRQIESAYPINNVTWRIASVEIHDKPRYPYRGMLLDVSRHFFSKTTLERFIDLMALYKMNMFQLHLTDDQGWRLQLKKYPRLTSVGAYRPQTVIGHPYDRVHFYDGRPVDGYYSERDVKEIVQYAKERHVTIIPEIDVPGHSSALLAAYPQFGCIKKVYKVKTEFHIFPDVMCPTEKSFAFLAGVFGEVAKLFPGPYIHVGGDEVMKEQWKGCKSCRSLMKAHDLKNDDALQAYFERRLEKIINGLGKRMIGWEEIIKGGRISPKAIVTAWLDPHAASKAVRSGHDVIIGMSDHLYFNQFESYSRDAPMSSSWQPPITLKDVYDYDIVPKGFTPEGARHILGGQGSIWTNFISTRDQVEHAALPRMNALAEILWSPKVRRAWPYFLARETRSFRRLKEMGVHASHAVYKVSARHRVVGKAVEVTLTTAGKGHVIRYTLDGSPPTMASPIYRGPLLIKAPTLIRAIGQDAVTGMPYGDFRMRVVPHKALGKPVRFLEPPRRLYKPGPEKVLVDGVVVYDGIFHPDEWAEFRGHNCDAVIDFGKPTSFHSVSFGYDAGMYRRLFSPQAVRIMVSNDDKAWRLVKAVSRNAIVKDRPHMTVTFPSVTARYLRFIAVNNRKVFNTRLQAKTPVSIYIDELVVN